MCMGNYYNTCNISILLFHHCQSIAHVHEIYFTLRYQIGKHEHFIFVMTKVYIGLRADEK